LPSRRKLESITILFRSEQYSWGNHAVVGQKVPIPIFEILYLCGGQIHPEAGWIVQRRERMLWMSEVVTQRIDYAK
jgi:hypothetical protein